MDATVGTCNQKWNSRVWAFAKWYSGGCRGKCDTCGACKASHEEPQKYKALLLQYEFKGLQIPNLYLQALPQSKNAGVGKQFPPL